MDLQKLFNSCEILLMQMKEDGYCEDYIKNVRFEINWIKRNPKLLQCTSYLELYEERLKTGRNPESSQERIYHKRSLFTILQRFEENNEFPNHHKKVPLVQKSAYSKLRGAFKELVDYYKRYAILNDYSVNTITKCVSKASCFLLHLQRSGHDSLETVTESDVISFFTDDNGALCRSRSYRKDVESVLTAAEPLNPLTKKIRLFLPTIKRRRKNIQYFTQEESLRLRDALENGATELTKRDLAIGMLLYFTGLRAGDISDLQLNEIDWQSEIICRKQSKTGVSVELPMSVGVGNALFEYITKERPDKPDSHVFLWNKPPYMPIDVQHRLCPALPLFALLFHDVKEQATGIESAELMDAQLAIREEKERTAVDRMKAAYGEKYDPMMMHDIKRDVANMLNEEVIVRPIRERLHQKQKHQTQQRQNGKKNRDSWER